MAKNLSDVNYDTKLSTDDLKFSSDSRETDILERTKINFGEYSGAGSNYGVIDQIDPKDLVSTDATRPLLVKTSTIDALRIDVNSGVAICPNGTIVNLEASVTDFALARTNIDDIIVVFLENEIIPSGVSRVSKYLTAGQTRYIQNPDKLRSVLIADYNNSSLFPPSRKQNMVVIAMIKIVSGVSGLELFIDYTNNDYPFNRPWFSTVDAQHRAYKGSGEATARNPHGTTFNDLSTGSIPFYSQVSGVGSILAKDIDIKGRPGYACVESIDPSAILTDSTGNITSESRYGGINAKYFLLANYPASTSSLHLQSHKSRALAFDWIKGTRIVVLPAAEVFTETATMYYNRVSALEIPSFINGNKITFGQPDTDNEFIVSGGLSYGTLANTTMEFEGTGPVARKFKVYLNDSGDLIKFPQVLQNTILLDSIGTDFIALEVSQFGPAQLGLALADAVSSANLRVTVRVFGTNTQNVVITEDLTFDSSWVNSVLPSVENLNNIKKTAAVFNTITGFQVIERVSDGASAKIIIYAEIESGTAQRLNDLALIANIDWDGISISNVRDMRLLKTFFPGTMPKYEGPASMYGIGTLDYILTEEYSAPKYNDATPSTQGATPATTTITFTDDVTAGDTIQVAVSKTLVAVVGTPNRTIGEFKIGTASETRDDAILTMNNVSFSSGFSGTADGTTKMKVASTTLGTRGNGTIIITTAVSQSITKEGNAVGGYDSFGEIVIPHHSECIDSPIPSPSTYDVMDIRTRYMSRAIPVNYKQNLKVVIHGIKVPYSKVQVRYRIANDTIDWNKWEVVGTLTSSVFSITSASNITKIQVEIFGKCEGFSLFEG
jgi:hypothetical protein